MNTNGKSLNAERNLPKLRANMSLKTRAVLGWPLARGPNHRNNLNVVVVGAFVGAHPTERERGYLN